MRRRGRLQARDVERVGQREHEVHAGGGALDPPLGHRARRAPRRGGRGARRRCARAARRWRSCVAGGEQVARARAGRAPASPSPRRASPRRAPARARAGARIQPSRSAGASDLRRGADVGDPLGVEPLERRERAAVVAELRVVVVLDHQPVARRAPSEQRVAALAAPITAPVGYWWLGVTTATSAPVALERVDAQPLAVERARRPAPARRRGGLPVVVERRVLERDPARAARRQHARRAARSPGCSRRRRRPSRAAAAVPRTRPRWPASASRSAAAAEAVAVVERGVGRRRRRARDRARPRAAREQRDVGRGRREVEAHGAAVRGRAGARRPPSPPAGGHDGARAAARGEPALGGRAARRRR